MQKTLLMIEGAILAVPAPLQPFVVHLSLLRETPDFLQQLARRPQWEEGAPLHGGMVLLTQRVGAKPVYRYLALSQLSATGWHWLCPTMTVIRSCFNCCKIKSTNGYTGTVRIISLEDENA